MDDTLRIDADRDHLFRILSNLVRNAIEAIEGAPGSLHGEIRVRAWRDGRRVFVEVRDNGPGVPPKAREHLFEAFTGSQRKGGTGLGLAIAAEIIGVHGGHVRLLDTAKGAAFQFEIPDRGVHHGHDEPDRAGNSGTPAATTVRRVRQGPCAGRVRAISSGELRWGVQLAGSLRPLRGPKTQTSARSSAG